MKKYLMKVLFCAMFVVHFALSGGFVLAKDGETRKTWGDFSVLYYGFSECETGMPGIGIRPMSSFSAYEDFNLYFSGRWGLGLDWNRNNLSMGNFVISNRLVNVPDFSISSIGAKIKYQLTDPESTDAALRVFLIWRSLNFEWPNAIYSPNGFGGGLDGYFKMGKNLEGYGQLDWVSANGNVLNFRMNTNVFRYEVGMKYYFDGKNLFARIGYRGEKFHFDRDGWNDGSLRGFVIGVGSKF